MKRQKLAVSGLFFIPVLGVIIIFWGGKYSEVLDFLSFCIRATLSMPIKTRHIALPPSSDNAWRLEGINHQWTYHDVGDMSSCEIVAWHNGKPFRGGINLAQRNWAKLLADSRPEWVSNSVVAFHPRYVSTQTTVTLTVVNDTVRQLPFVSILGSPYFMIFEMVPHARLELTCHVPGEIINWIVGHEELSCDKQVPPPDPNKPLRGIKMTIHDQNPSIVFDEISRDVRPPTPERGSRIIPITDGRQGANDHENK